MANKEHVRILMQGVGAWNKWRDENLKVWPDLEGVKLEDYNLVHANLRDANLSGAYLKRATLTGATLTSANLVSANLVGANLVGTDVVGADLTGANLESADLRNANLENAYLESADLWGANLIGANLLNTFLRGAKLAFTAFINVDLSEAAGIEDVIHDGPSSIGTDTLECTARGIKINPSRKNEVEKFLRGAGVEEHMVHYFRSMIGKPIEFYSCFISYSHADKAFARRMYDSLQGKGIRCWLDEHDATVGTPIQDAIDRGFKMTEKVLLCCSKHSLASTWVLREVTKAFTKEEQLTKQSGKPCYVLIPLDVDGHLFKKDGGGGFIWDHGWSDEVRNRIAADFTGWKEENDKFEAQFERVVKALNAEEAMAEVQRGE